MKKPKTENKSRGLYLNGLVYENKPSKFYKIIFEDAEINRLLKVKKKIQAKTEGGVLVSLDLS